MKQLTYLSALALAVLLLAGCGGNATHKAQSSPAGTAGSVATGRGQATLTVTWTTPKRSRLIPSAANAIHLVITDTATPAYTWLETVLTRPATGATSSTNTFDNLPAGVQLIATATAYSSFDLSGAVPTPTGSPLATGQAAFAVSTTAKANISLVLASTVDHIVLTQVGGATMMLGDSQTYTATAYDKPGNVLLLAPGVLKWSAVNVNGAQAAAVAKVDPVTGLVSGLTEGKAVITATDSESGIYSSVTVTVSKTTTLPISVYISPSTVSIQVLSYWHFSAVVKNGKTGTVTWSVDGDTPTLFGSVTNDGVFAAPATAGVYHVTATSTEDTTAKATATIVVNTAITLTPAICQLDGGTTITFTARAAGFDRPPTITWAIQEGEGGGNGSLIPVDVYATGTYPKCTYTAPLGGAGYKVFHVVATSMQNQGISAVATITVGPAPAAPTQIAIYGVFNAPRGIAVAADGSYYVADTGNNTVVHYDNAGAPVPADNTRFAALGLNAPIGVALDGNGRLYIADSWNARIVVADATGVQQAKWDRLGELPQGLAVDGSGSVYMADSTGCQIVKTDSLGNAILSWGMPGATGSQFMGPIGVAVDNVGNVYIADTQNNRIQKFNAASFLLAQWGVQGSSTGEFDQPNGVAVDAVGNVYVADTNNDRIQKFSPGGAYLGAFGTTGAGATNFNHPTAIGVDASGKIYVVDTGNNRVVKYNAF